MGSSEDAKPEMFHAADVAYTLDRKGYAASGRYIFAPCVSFACSERLVHCTGDLGRFRCGHAVQAWLAPLPHCNSS